MMDKAIGYFLNNFEKVESTRRLKSRRRRIGSELKFPLVTPDGRAANLSKTQAFWDFLALKGWKPLIDPHSRKIIGATKQGEMNEHRVSCETGYCKIEFSLAHTDNLITLYYTIEDIKKLLTEFSEEHKVAFLGFGLQPVTPPGKHLLMKKSRNLFWERLFGGNNYISPENGTDVHLFTISAANQVHIDVTMDEAIDAINVFNGIAGAQVAMTANSNIWRGKIDPEYKCLGEMFWEWWLKERHQTRYGVPERKFNDLKDYFLHILKFPPVYVRREGTPVALPYCPTFSDFYFCSTEEMNCERGTLTEGRCGLTAEGRMREVNRELYDLDQHFTFFWHNARLSRYYTLENRINDQQPSDEIMAIPALTLGIMENLNNAVSLINGYPWKLLMESRILSAQHGLNANVHGIPILQLSKGIVEIAEHGLKKRGLGEEVFLTPLKERLEEKFCPADVAARTFRAEGPEGFVEKFKVVSSQ